MPEPSDSSDYQNRRRYLAPLFGLSLAFVLVLAACPLSVVAVQQRLISPPTFTFNIGDVEFAAPCPIRRVACPPPLPWYAIWRGDPEPDGSMTYRQIFFIYLKPNKRH
jgi:hypothetical protein